MIYAQCGIPRNEEIRVCGLGSDQAARKTSCMARAAGRAANMTEGDAEEWLRLGERFETKLPPKA